MEVELSPGELKDRKADERGRVALGPEFADKQVVVAVLEANDADEDENNENGAEQTAP